jgi:hypothetical protein
MCAQPVSLRGHQFGRVRALSETCLARHHGGWHVKGSSPRLPKPASLMPKIHRKIGLSATIHKATSVTQITH